MKTIRIVKCSERLPKERGDYFVDLYGDGHKAVREYSKEYANWWIENVECWYESIEVELKSEDILPQKDRYTSKDFKNILSPRIDELEQYHKALEAAEIEISDLKTNRSSKSFAESSLDEALIAGEDLKDKSIYSFMDLINRYDGKIDELNKTIEVVKDRWLDLAKNRRMEAEMHLYGVEGNIYEPKRIDEAIKIAAGL